MYASMCCAKTTSVFASFCCRHKHIKYIYIFGFSETMRISIICKLSVFFWKTKLIKIVDVDILSSYLLKRQLAAKPKTIISKYNNIKVFLYSIARGKCLFLSLASLSIALMSIYNIMSVGFIWQQFYYIAK